MPIKQVMVEGRVPVKIWTDKIDDGARNQLRNISVMPFIHKHVAAMPDVHLGKGATVGSVIPTKGAIIPAAVGVDIGCGMNAIRLSLKANDLPDTLETLFKEIERVVPLGAGGEHKYARGGDGLIRGYFDRFQKITDKHPRVIPQNPKKWVVQLGTLGSGNHFIEICLDESDNVWIMLHSGSRGIGNIIGSYFIEQARKEMERMYIHLPDKDLAYLVEDSKLFEDYIEAVDWAQDYAMENRRVMLRLVWDAMVRLIPKKFEAIGEAVNCHHNYVARENHFGANVWVTRKGAIRAREGDLGIIPGSMGTRSYIVRGKGNQDSFHSCSHGAGRELGRNEAKRLFTVEDLHEQTKGIVCRKDAGVLDEIPGAYKSIDQVMEDQTDLVEVVHTLRQIVNVKG